MKSNDAHNIWPFELNDVNIYADFVQIFKLSEYKNVIMYIRADSQYVTWINGKFSGYGQYPDYPFYTVYDKLDISDKVQSGKNRLCILGYCQNEGSSVYYPGKPSVRFWIEADGEVIAVSGKETVGRKDPCYQSGYVPKFSGQLSFGFEYNSNGYDNWIEKDSDGFSEVECTDNTMTPVLRPVLKTLLSKPISAKICASGNVNADLSDMETGHRMQSAEWDDSNPNGFYRIFDLGRETAGLLELDFEATKECEVNIGFGEHLADGRVRTYSPPRNFAVRYFAHSGYNKFTHYMKRLGCRYLMAYFYIEEKDLKINSVTLSEVSYPVKHMPLPELPDERAYDIYNTGVRTLELCMHEHYEDTPWREQALYAMDARNQMLCGYYAFSEYCFARESLRMLALGLRDDGLLELCAPGKTNVTIPMFSLMFVVALDEYLSYSGDSQFISDVIETVKTIMNTAKSKITHRGLLDRFCEPQFWNFYEWSLGLDGGEIDRKDYLSSGCYELPLNAVFVKAAHAMKRLYAAVGEIGGGEWKELGDKVSHHIHEVYYSKEGFYYGVYSDNKVSLKTQLATAMAVWCGACPKENLKNIIPAIKGELDLTPVTLSSQIFRYEALLQDDAQIGFIYDDINAKFGTMLDAGATSFWETEIGQSDFDNAGSLCHGWSAIPVYIYHRCILKQKDKIKE